MNPEKIGKQIVKRILMEEEMTKVSLYPGAFKPPHKGHVEVALRSIDDKTDKVIVFLSTKEREGVDIEQAKKVWDLYKANIPELEKIEIHPTPTPVKAVYDYAKDNPAHDIRAVFGKGEEDRFKSLLDKEKYPHVEVFDAGVVDDFSATTLRKAIKDNDLETIEDYIPYLINVDDFLSIFKTDSLNEDKEIELDDKEQEIVNDILSSISEGATAIRVIDKFKDYSRKGLLTMSIVLGVMQGLEAQNTVQSDINKIQQTGIELVQQTKVTDEASENLIKRELGDQELEQIQKKAEENDYFFVAKKSKNFNFNKNRAINQAQENSNYSGSILTKDSTTYNTDDGQELYVMFYKVSNLKIKTKIVNEAIVGNKIVCDNCGWEWKIKDGGDDLYICHKCGHDNTPNKDYLQEARYKKFLNESWDDSKAKIINKFMDYTTDYLSIDRPKIKLINQGDYTQQHRSFGGYSPSDQKIMVVVHNRNMADILRTLAHELVHHMQNLDNRLTPKSGEDGSPDENEANSLAAVIMRKFGRENPDIYE